MATPQPQKPQEEEPVLETAEDTARVSNAVDLLMDLCAERGAHHDETALDVVAHVGAEVRAMAQRVAATIRSKAHASVAVEDLQALHARAMSALETAGVPTDFTSFVAKIEMIQQVPALEEERPAVVVEEAKREPTYEEQSTSRGVAFLKDVEAMSLGSGSEREAATRRVSLTFSGNDGPLRVAATRLGALGALAKAHEAACAEGNTEVAISAARAAAALVPSEAEPLHLAALASPTLKMLRLVLEHSTDCTTSTHQVAVAVAHLTVLLQQGWTEDKAQPRVLEALVAATCDAARACKQGLGECCDSETAAVTAFAVSNLAALSGARVELVRQGAIEVLATWLDARPLSELHRHAAAAARRLAGAGDGGAAGPNGSVELRDEDVFARGWLDAKLTDKSLGLLKALSRIIQDDNAVSAVRAHTVTCLAELSKRSPNRRAVVETGGSYALLHALKRCVSDLHVPARRHEAADLAQRACTALAAIALEPNLQGDRVSADLVDGDVLGPVVACLALAAPRSPLRLAAARLAARVSEDDLDAKRCLAFFQGGGSDPSEIQPVDALLVLGGGLDHSDDGGSTKQIPTPRWGRGRSETLERVSVAEAGAFRRPDAREAAHAAYALANLAARPDPAAKLLWERGALPVLLQLHRSPRAPLRARAMRALASLAAPLVTHPARDADYGRDVDDGAASAAAITVAKAALATLRDDDAISTDAETRAFRAEATYEAARCVKNLAFAAPLRAALVAGALKRLLALAVGGGAEPRLKALAEATLVALGLEGGAADLELCGNDARLLEEWVEMRASLEAQRGLERDYARALRDAWADTDDLSDDDEPDEDEPAKAPLDVFAGKLREVLLNPHVAALKLAEFKNGGLFRCTSVDPYEERLPEQTRPASPTALPILTSPLAPTALVARLSSAPGTPLPATPLAQDGQNMEQKLFRHIRSASSASNLEEDEHEAFVNAATRLPHWWASERRARQSHEDDDKTPPVTPVATRKRRRRAADRGAAPKDVQQFLERHFPSSLQRRAVAPFASPCADDTWLRALALPRRQYFSFRREARVLGKLLEQDGYTSYGAVFRDSTFAGEFCESLGSFLARQPRVTSLAFVASLGGLPGAQIDDSTAVGLFTSQPNESAQRTTALAYLVGSLPLSVASITLDCALGRDGLQILGILLRTAEERRRSSLRDANTTTTAGPAPGLLAVRGHDHLQPDDFASLALYVGACVGESSSRLRCLVSLDLHGNRLGDATASAFVRALDRDDAPVEALDLGANNLGPAKLTLDALIGAQGLDDRDVPPKRGCVLCRGKLRTLSLAANSLGPRPAARLLRALGERTPAPKLRSLSLKHSSFGPPCGLGALAAVASALKRVAAKGALEDLDLDGCRLQPDAAREILSGLRERSADDAYALASGEAVRGLSFVRLTEGNQVHRDDARAIARELRRCRAGAAARARALRERAPPSPVPEKEVPPPPSPLTARLQSEMAALKSFAPPKAIQRADGANLQRRAASWTAGVESPRARPPPLVACLFAAPLAWQDSHGGLHGIEGLDGEAEREAIAKALEERRAHDDQRERVSVEFRAATTEALQAALTSGARVLHYSGHGHPQCLTFEDGRGGLQPVPPRRLEALVRPRPPQLAVVCACHSLRAAQALVTAGVKHVVAVSLDEPLLDAAAVAFTRSFYHSLSVGDSVRRAFDGGVEAVAASPRVGPNWASKFELIPKDGDHDAQVLPRSLMRRKVLVAAAAPGPPPRWPPRTTLSKNAPRPPEDFLGREVDAFKVLDALLARRRRFVSLVGPVGVGKSALAAFVAEYVDARAMFRAVVFLKVDAGASKADIDLLLAEASTTHDDDGEGKTLLVLDLAAEGGEVKRFLAAALDARDRLVVLSTQKVGLDRPSEHEIPLGPLDLGNAARLFARQCPRLHTASDRRRFHALVTSARFEGASSIILDALLGGLPGAIVAAAFRASRDDLEGLLAAARASGTESAVAVGDHPLLTGSNTPL